VAFVLWHHVQKGTRLSPSLLFIVVVLGGEPGNEAKSLHCVEPMVPNCDNVSLLLWRL